MKSLYLRSGLALLCAVILSACGGSDGSLYLSGYITGLNKPDLVLINKGNGEKLSIASGASAFAFTKLVAVDESFDVEVDNPPTGGYCTVSSNTGKANVYNAYSVQVTCYANPYTLGGTVNGLTGDGLVLANGSDTVAIPKSGTAGAAVSFTFPTTVGDGANYGVTVLTQPSGQQCTVANGTATMGSSNYSGLVVNCAAQ